MLHFTRRAASAVASAFIAAVPAVSFAADPPEKVPETPEPGHEYEDIVITASPLGRTLFELSSPVGELSGEELLTQMKSTLGETLSSMPGVNSTYYGPGASRPVIRGLDSEHVKVLQNGLGSIDASAASADHAVSLDPLSVEKIEVVRGPAALLYGSTAVGGVVNTIDNRIPDERIDVPARGTIEGSLGSVDESWRSAFVLESGQGGLNLHLDGFRERTDDVDIPGGTLENSALDSRGGAFGLSYVGEAGYIGIAPSVYETEYGTVAEEDVTIEMKQHRWDLAGGLDSPAPGIEKLEAKVGFADYEHTEFEGAEVGTIFKNRGHDARIELRHEKLGPIEGVLGFQNTSSDASALGDEAFVPGTVTNIYSPFVFEEFEVGPVRFDFGGRMDSSRIRADSDPVIGPGGNRNFTTGAGSIGVIYTPADDWALGLSSAYTQRAPSSQELFANGPHVATDAFEVGDRDLDVEKSVGADVFVRKKEGFASGSLGGFYNYFEDFVSLEDTGAVDPGSGLAVFQYLNVPATFLGAEGELTFHLLDSDPDSVHLELQADYVRVRNRDTGDPLPRISPLRLWAGLVYQGRGLNARVGVKRVQPQHRNADNETETDGYTMLDASLTYEIPIGRQSAELFLIGSNLTDQTARNAVSFLKDIAPLPGASVRGGVRLSF